MSFTKITQADTTGKGNVGKADSPGLSMADMQALLDELPNLIITKHNAHIDELEAATAEASGAGNIGAAPIAGLTGGTVQALLEALKTYADNLVIAAGAVTRVFGRVGDVSAQSGDYNGGQIPLTGYEKPAATAAIAASDSANTAIGKLEKALDGKLSTETDPTVPSWAKAASKPAYTASEVGALAAPSQATALPETLADNTEYRVASLSGDYTFVFPSGNFEVYIALTTAADFTSLSWPAGTTFLSTVPSFEASKSYEISIKDSIVVAAEVISA